jgi:hypothetical protein
MQTAIFSFHVCSQNKQLLIITTLLRMLSIQNHMEFQLFILRSVKILIWIYLMNTSYFYCNIHHEKTRRPSGWP